MKRTLRRKLANNRHHFIAAIFVVSMVKKTIIFQNMKNTNDFADMTFEEKVALKRQKEKEWRDLEGCSANCRNHKKN